MTPAFPGTSATLQVSMLGGYAVAHAEAVLPGSQMNQTTRGLPSSWDAGDTRSEICPFPRPSLRPNLSITNFCPYVGINTRWGQRATAQGSGYWGHTASFVI